MIITAFIRKIGEGNIFSLCVSLQEGRGAGYLPSSRQYNLHTDKEVGPGKAYLFAGRLGSSSPTVGRGAHYAKSTCKQVSFSWAHRLVSV